MSDITYGEKWTVYWSDYMSDAYIYGSEVIFHSNDDVELKNNLMPAGSVIKSWYSKTNYQMQRIENVEEPFVERILLSGLPVIAVHEQRKHEERAELEHLHKRRARCYRHRV